MVGPAAVPQVGGMKRNPSNFLLSLLLGLALTFSGAAAAGARLAMAVDQATTNEFVVCGDGGARIVVLNWAGEPVAPLDSRSCANCPDCRQTLAFTLPGCAVVAPVLLSASTAAPELSPTIVLTRALSPVQARPPPKGT